MTATKLAKQLIGDTVPLSPEQLLKAGKHIIAGDRFIIRKDVASGWIVEFYDGNQGRLRSNVGAYFVDSEHGRIVPIRDITCNDPKRERKIEKKLEEHASMHSHAFMDGKQARPSRKKVREHVDKTGRHRVLYQRHFRNHISVAVVGYTTDN